MKNRWETVETVADFILGGSKITADGDCSHEIKRPLLLWRKVMTKVHSILKSRDITLVIKVHLVKAVVFPVAMYVYESWTIKKAECWRIDIELWCWRRLLRVPWTARRSNQSILKDIISKWTELTYFNRKLQLHQMEPCNQCGHHSWPHSYLCLPWIHPRISEPSYRWVFWPFLPQCESSC